MGKVIFIGAGPGSADLITVRGAQRLALADVVLFDALADPALRDLAPNATWVDVGKRGFVDGKAHGSMQQQINDLIIEHARSVPTVARLKGGDPSIFGRLDEELAAVRAAGLDSEVVPGVTAALAAAAGTQRPLTRRGVGRSVSLATAMTRTGDLHATRTADTEVYYMAGKQLGELAQRLQDAGWPADTPVSAVSRAGWADQLNSQHTLATLAQASAVHAGRPTAVVVGVGATDVGSHQ
ncbi:uroporphyrinogen-III C-methyltransferase [Aquabacterium sp.]|uniref:uroporphyrinogen-III C-methyltransferase n=1 Tax=Aquabacterium sp. TaxID=1872578 RepID=UPI0035B48473